MTGPASDLEVRLLVMVAHLQPWPEGRDAIDAGELIELLKEAAVALGALRDLMAVTEPGRVFARTDKTAAWERARAAMKPGASGH